MRSTTVSPSIGAEETKLTENLKDMRKHHIWAVKEGAIIRKTRTERKGRAGAKGHRKANHIAPLLPQADPGLSH